MQNQWGDGIVAPLFAGRSLLTLGVSNLLLFLIDSYPIRPPTGWVLKRGDDPLYLGDRHLSVPDLVGTYQEDK